MNSRIIFIVLLVLVVLGLFLFPQSKLTLSSTPAPQLLVTAAAPYQHFTKSFTMRLPDGWGVNVRDDGLLASEPNGGAFIDVSVVNTGLPLAAAGVERYVTAIEQNFFATFADYQLTERRVNADGCVQIIRTLKSKNEAKVVTTYYCAGEGVMRQLDFWVPADRVPQYAGLGEAVAASLIVDVATVKSLQPYAARYVFADASKQFEFRMAYSWRRETTNNTETFTSPDGANVWQHQTLEGNADVLGVLKVAYPDLTVQEDKTDQGYRRLTWATATLKGWTLSAAIGPRTWLVIWVVQAAAAEKYATMGDAMLSSYKVFR